MIDCKYWEPCGVENGGCCSDNRFGGKPSFGVCGDCEHRKGRDGEGVMKLIRAVPKIVTALTVSGVEIETERRLSICGRCEWFTGSRCMKCGCFTAMKARLASQHCPIGKW